MPLSTTQYRNVSGMLYNTGAFVPHVTNKKVLDIDMHKAMNNKEIVRYMSQCLFDDMKDCLDDFGGPVTKVIAMDSLSIMVATGAGYLDDTNCVLRNAPVLPYDKTNNKLFGKLEIDDKVLVVCDVVYGCDLDSYVKIIKQVGSRGSQVVALAACIDMEQNVLQCLAGRTTREFLPTSLINNCSSKNSGGDGGGGDGGGGDDDNENSIAIVGIDILSLTAIQSHLVSLRKMDAYLVNRVMHYLTTEYNEWLARRDAELRSQYNLFIYQHDPTTWHYNGYLNTWMPGHGQLSTDVLKKITYIKSKNKQNKQNKQNNKNKQNNQNTLDTSDASDADTDTTISTEEAKRLDDVVVPIPDVYINPIIMDLTSIKCWGIIKHRIQNAITCPVDGSVDEDGNPTGNLSNIVLDYNGIDDWDIDKVKELMELRAKGGFNILAHNHSVYSVYDKLRPVDIQIETVHFSCLEDITLFMESVKKGRIMRGDSDYRKILDIKFNKYTVEQLLNNNEFWNILRELVLITYASRTYHISGIIFNFNDLSELDKLPRPPKNYNLSYLVPVFFKLDGYAHHKAVVYGPKTKSDEDYIRKWNKVNDVLNYMDCSGLYLDNDLVQPNVAFDKKWVMYYKLLRHIKPCHKLIKTLQKWKYIAPLADEASSTVTTHETTQSTDVTDDTSASASNNNNQDNITLDNTPLVNTSNILDDEYEEDPDAVINVIGKNTVNAKNTKLEIEAETVAMETFPILICSSLISIYDDGKRDYTTLYK